LQNLRVWDLRRNFDNNIAHNTSIYSGAPFGQIIWLWRFTFF